MNVVVVVVSKTYCYFRVDFGGNIVDFVNNNLDYYFDDDDYNDDDLRGENGVAAAVDNTKTSYCC